MLAIALAVTLIRGEFVPGQQPDGNTVVFEAPQGLVVVDTGRHAKHTDRIVEHAGDRKVVAIVNTHWHLDHVSGNTRFPDATVYASAAIESAMGGFLANYRKQLATDAGKHAAEIARIDQGDRLFPDVVVGQSQAIELGGRSFELGYFEHAATAGDVTVFDPKSKVLAAGDLVTLPAPFLDTACPARWRDALESLDAMPFEQLVPGHGRVLTHAEFGVYRKAFGELVDCETGCAAKWKAAVDPLLDDAERRQVDDLMAYYVDLRHRTQDCGPLDLSSHDAGWPKDAVAATVVDDPSIEACAAGDVAIGQVMWGDQEHALGPLATRAGDRLTFKPRKAAPIVFRDWTLAEAKDREGESRKYRYLGPGGDWHRVQVDYGHDSPGTYFVNADSGAMAYAHNGGQVVALDPAQQTLVTFEPLNEPHRLVVATFGATQATIDYECRLTWSAAARADTCGWTDADTFAGSVGDTRFELRRTADGFAFARSDDALAADCRAVRATSAARRK